jgi:hypothetical protein
MGTADSSAMMPASTATDAAPSMHGAARGLLAIWHGAEPGYEPTFDDWYDRQHHRERVGIPGFRRARRYVNLGAGPRYFSRYDVDAPSVLASVPYLHALNHPTAWTQAVMPRYRNTTRAVFAYAGGAGDAEGGDLVTLRLAVGSGEARVPSASELSRLVEAPGVLRVEVWRADRDVSSLRTEEKKLRGAADDVVAQAILVEGSAIDRVGDAVARHLLPLLDAVPIVDRYRFVFGLARDRGAA